MEVTTAARPGLHPESQPERTMQGSLTPLSVLGPQAEDDPGERGQKRQRVAPPCRPHQPAERQREHQRQGRVVQQVAPYYVVEVIVARRHRRGLAHEARAEVLAQIDQPGA